MKKFFELSILERKAVKGNTELTAETLSANDEVLGKLEVCVNNEESKAGAYAKYIPNGDENTAIASIRLLTDDQEKLKKALEEVKEACITAAMKDSKNMLLNMLLSSAIDAEAGKINLSIVPIPVTNSLISMVMKTEWLGVEVKFDPQIQESIGKLEEVMDDLQPKETTMMEDLDNFLKS